MLAQRAMAEACSQSATVNHFTTQHSQPARAQPPPVQAICFMRRMRHGAKSGGTTPPKSGGSSIAMSGTGLIPLLIGSNVIARDTEPQIVVLRITHRGRLVAPDGKRAGIALQGFH